MAKEKKAGEVYGKARKAGSFVGKPNKTGAAQPKGKGVSSGVIRK